MANSSSTKGPDLSDFLGDWQLVSTNGCEEIFPKHVEFRKLGIYSTADGVEVGALWHGGDWEIEDTILKVQGAYDQMLQYDLVEWKDGNLRLKGAGSCEVHYVRG